MNRQRSCWDKITSCVVTCGVVHDRCCRCVLPIPSLAQEETISLLIGECPAFIFILAGLVKDACRFPSRLRPETRHAEGVPDLRIRYPPKPRYRVWSQIICSGVGRKGGTHSCAMIAVFAQRHADSTVYEVEGRVKFRCSCSSPTVSVCVRVSGCAAARVRQRPLFSLRSCLFVSFPSITAKHDRTYSQTFSLSQTF